jgi:hypothetical protein
MEFGSIIISETAVNSENPQDVNSNISVINLMREREIDDDLIHEDFDELLFRFSQYTEGNFAQFVYNSHWNEELNELIEEGLTLLGHKTFGVVPTTM